VVKMKNFNTTLKQLTDGLERMCSGNRFHSDGAATANERVPNFVEVQGMTRSSQSADTLPSSEHAWSVRWGGA